MQKFLRKKLKNFKIFWKMENFDIFNTRARGRTKKYQKTIKLSHFEIFSNFRSLSMRLNFYSKDLRQKWARALFCRKSFEEKCKHMLSVRKLEKISK